MLLDDAESNASGLNVPDQKYYYKNKKSEDNWTVGGEGHQQNRGIKKL